MGVLEESGSAVAPPRVMFAGMSDIWRREGEGKRSHGQTNLVFQRGRGRSSEDRWGGTGRIEKAGKRKDVGERVAGTSKRLSQRCVQHRGPNIVKFARRRACVCTLLFIEKCVAY